MESIKTQGIVLRRYPYSETSLIVHFFSEKLGKVKTMVKGAKRPKGRFFGKLELCSIVELLLYPRTHSELHTLTDVTHVQTLEPLRTDLAKFAHAMVLLELVEATFEVESPHPDFYHDFISGMRLLAERPMDVWLPVLVQLKMLYALGLLPSHETCQECGNPMEGDFFFSVSRGACRCRRCVHERSDWVQGQCWQIPILKSVTQCPLEQCAGATLSQAQKGQFFDWTRKCLDGVVHKRIRSYAFLSGIPTTVKD